jgi:hypothetical protein
VFAPQHGLAVRIFRKGAWEPQHQRPVFNADSEPSRMETVVDETNGKLQALELNLENYFRQQESILWAQVCVPARRAKLAGQRAGPGQRFWPGPFRSIGESTDTLQIHASFSTIA